MDNSVRPGPDPAAPFDGAELLARIAELGEYFALPTHNEGDWHEVSHLLDPATVIDFVDRTRAAIATSIGCDPDSVPIRLAASSFQLGVAARLLSPVVAAASCFVAVPMMTAESVKWQAIAHHCPRFTMDVAECVGVQTATEAAGVISASLVGSILGPLNETLRTTTALSLRVTWGNVISAANGAVTVLAMMQPRLQSRGRALVWALMDTEQLTKTGGFVQGKFARRSCCLFCLAPESGLCTDCVLTVSDRSHQTGRK